MNATGLCFFCVRAAYDKDGVCETQRKINENNAYRVVFLRSGSRRGENTVTSPLNIQIDVLLLCFEKNEYDLVAATATGSANHHINIH